MAKIDDKCAVVRMGKQPKWLQVKCEGKLVIRPGVSFLLTCNECGIVYLREHNDTTH